MSDSDSGGSGAETDRPAPLTEARDRYLLPRGKGTRQLERDLPPERRAELNRFIDYLWDQVINCLEEIDSQILRNYVAQALLDRDLRTRSTQKYYDYVSAWIGWARRQRLVAEHYGIQQTAREIDAVVGAVASHRHPAVGRDRTAAPH